MKAAEPKRFIVFLPDKSTAYAVLLSFFHVPRGTLHFIQILFIIELDLKSISCYNKFILLIIF